MTSVCTVDQDLLNQIEVLRRDNSQGNAAIVCKIDQSKFLVVQESDGFVNIEELGDELPESSPRYIILSFKLTHDDGRVSYPMVFVNYSPSGAKTELCMLYASSRTQFQRVAQTTKTLDVDDAELLNLEWLQDKLKPK
ncbi:MAG: hypothetical protein J3Q66DRAFT_320175 [Benniella sp.]|nr:MAG: hypothetical protein J3Q66DRAFT_320175 [Benniella sp.]